MYDLCTIYIVQTFFRYLICTDVLRKGCRARATIPGSGDLNQLRITTPHNHPPDAHAGEKIAFLSKLKSAVNAMPGRLTDIYSGIAELYI